MGLDMRCNFPIRSTLIQKDVETMVFVNWGTSSKVANNNHPLTRLQALVDCFSHVKVPWCAHKENIIFKMTINLREILSVVANVVNICDRSKIRDFCWTSCYVVSAGRCFIVVQKILTINCATSANIPNNGDPTAEKMAMHKYARNSMVGEPVGT